MNVALMLSMVQESLDCITVYLPGTGFETQINVTWVVQKVSCCKLKKKNVPKYFEVSSKSK